LKEIMPPSGGEPGIAVPAGDDATETATAAKPKNFNLSL
jgi:hypothetical protein